jgi:hypothetical protein
VRLLCALLFLLLHRQQQRGMEALVAQALELGVPEAQARRVLHALADTVRSTHYGTAESRG